MTIDVNVSRMLSAAYEGNADAVARCLEAGADVNARGFDGMNLLMTAAQFNNRDIVVLALSHGAALDDVSRDGRTALHIASFFNHQDCVRLIEDEAVARPEREARRASEAEKERLGAKENARAAMVAAKRGLLKGRSHRSPGFAPGGRSA